MDRHTTLLKTLGHVDRLRIVAVLERGELTVTELVHILGLSQPRVTQYIKSLEEVDVVERLREGSWVFSRLKRSEADITRLVTTVLNSLPSEDTILQADIQKLDEVRQARSEVADAFFADVANDKGQMGNEYLPQAQIEAELLKVAGSNRYNFMIDMGTGTGRMLELFANHIKTGVGIDANPGMLKVARHKLAAEKFDHISVQQQDLHTTPFRDGSADLVTLHQVMHYLDDPREAVMEAARLLTPKGVLLIVEFETHEIERFRDDYAHRRLGFSEADMMGYGLEAGLDMTMVMRLSNADNPDIVIWKAQKL